MKSANPRPHVKVAALVAAVMLLQGCAAAVVGAGIGAATVAHDRRSVGTQLDDKTLAGRVVLALGQHPDLEKQANINLHVYNNTLLLVGQAPSDALKQQAERAAKRVSGIRKIHNLIRTGTPVAATTKAHDIWLASKVRASLIADDRIDGLHISVTVEDSEVFLMGLVKPTEANIAVDISRNINGVARVVKAFEYL